ncbi:hypothetical protein [Streptomyces sp. NPDC013187]|uniref:hypothetical protein n=1 Tax=Streptomyces sp. NPDC013187 TaxID=3364865 RepID=UPI00369391E2
MQFFIRVKRAGALVSAVSEDGGPAAGAVDAGLGEGSAVVAVTALAAASQPGERLDHHGPLSGEYLHDQPNADQLTEITRQPLVQHQARLASV